jgi:hypothetical protein
MAIKVSNQITFTEHKKIVEIREWYLATNYNIDDLIIFIPTENKKQPDAKQDGQLWFNASNKENERLLEWKSNAWTVSNKQFTTTIQTMDKLNKYLWNYEETIYSLGSSDVTDPVILGVYGETGDSGASLQIKYISSKTVPTITNNNVSAWSDTVPSPADGEKIYMTQKLSTDMNWSTPIQISGADGEAGKDGSDIEYVYYRNNTGSTPSTPSYNSSNQLTTDWFASPQGIDKDHMYEFVSVRTKPAGSKQWSGFSTPVVWSKWGEKGQDGDGVEYLYYRSNSDKAPSYPGGLTWTDEPQGVTPTQQYEYVVQIKTVDEVQYTSSVALWAKYGADGRGISEIFNYYATTTTPDAPKDSDWSLDQPKNPLSPEYKYLWNYEVIQYTSGNPTTTSPAIIGAYGDSGASGSGSVDFQIYSVDGFEFSDSLTSITLQTVAILGGNVISSGITYQWKWWNDESTLEDKYENISGATSSTLSVSINDIYALSSIKCVIKYDGITYEDYVSLTQATSVYTAMAKFFDGNNVITANEEYLIVYIELYKNNDPEELLYSNNIYISDANTVQNNIMSTDITGTYTNGDLMYFVCKNTHDGITEYNTVLCKYSSNKWQVVESNYIYRNDLFANTTSPVVFIPKEKISRSLTINFDIYNNSNVVARTSAMVLDLNDPTISNTEPLDPKEGQLWLDTSVSPSVLKMWDGNQWVNSGYQNGNVVYTSCPTDGYSEGDLWILSEEDAELFEDFGPGTMLKATSTSSTFDKSHWIDVDKEATEQKKNIKQYFLFNPDTGLRIGQSDNKFYVNISSTRMSFCENPLVPSSGNGEYIDPNEVVSISNRSATIRNLTVEDGVTFNCEIKLGNFILKTESNGSLSLAPAN